MRWPELLETFAAALQTRIPDSPVCIGHWAVTPKTNIIHIAPLKISNNTDGTYGLHTLLWCADVFVRLPEDDSHLAAYKAMYQQQEIIEACIQDIFPNQPQVSSVQWLNWEMDGGAFFPTFGNRLMHEIRAIDVHSCG